MPAKAQLKTLSKAAGAGLAERKLRIVAPPKAIEVDANNLAAIGRLVGSVAHDFNNLLTGIMLCSELLAGGVSNDQRLLRQVRAIQSADHAGTWSAPVKIADLLAAGTRDPQTGAAVRDGSNLASVPRGLPRVAADATQIQQVILNLCINARDAMPAGGRIRLSTRNVSDSARCWVELLVRDTGAGMDKETLARLFEPYFTTKQAHTGYGLGLATTFGIVEQCGGKIVVESQPGCGATFRVLLPLLKTVPKLMERDSL